MGDDRPAGPDGGPRYIGRYRIVDRIGKGTMGVVYAAEDEAMGRRVAIKVMMADLREEPEVRERFQREARVTGQLTHPNIVTLFDFGEENGHPYIVMELLNGRSLTEYLRTAIALSLDAKIDLMMQACAGLQRAHAHGVIHRDIKPNNIVVQKDGTLKIVDFGIARLASSSLTMSGFLVGTPEYMSPEQAQGHDLDARSDLFSVAGVFYYMLTGHGPFSHGNLPRVLRAVVHEDPAPLTEADAPEALRFVIAKGLAKSPANRYQQCADMLTDLDRIRRTRDAATSRIVQAGLDRFQQVAALIEKRRAFGRSAGVPGIDAACDEATREITAEFPLFAGHAVADVPSGSRDRGDAAGALDRLKLRHNTELARLAALQQDAADTLHQQQSGANAGTGESPKADGPASSRPRAAGFWRRVTPGRGKS